jgi:arylsulfatase A-like enzyme
MLPDAAGELGFRTAYLATNLLVCRQFGFAREIDYYHGVGKAIGNSLSWLLMTGNTMANSVMRTRHVLIVNRLLFFVRTHWSGRRMMTASADGVKEKFLEFLDRDRDTPFCAYLHYMEPHIPYNPRPPFLEEFVDVSYPGPPLENAPSMHEAALPPLTFQKELPADQRQHLIDRYDGEIADFNASLGELFDALDERGLYDNTVIVFTSDHGEAFFDHGIWGHTSTPYQELIRVPLVIKFPEGKEAGKVVDVICRHVDLAPTILDILGEKPWPHLQGTSLLPAVEGGDWPLNWAVSDIHMDDAVVTSYLEGSRKLIHIDGPEEHWLLFDLESDPGEQRPLPATGSARLNELKASLQKWLDLFHNEKTMSGTTTISDEDMQRLRALGYGG